MKAAFVDEKDKEKNRKTKELSVGREESHFEAEKGQNSPESLHKNWCHFLPISMQMSESWHSDLSFDVHRLISNPNVCVCVWLDHVL